MKCGKMIMKMVMGTKLHTMQFTYKFIVKHVFLHMCKFTIPEFRNTQVCKQSAAISWGCAPPLEMMKTCLEMMKLEIVTKIVEIVKLETEIPHDAIRWEIDHKTCLFTYV